MSRLIEISPITRVEGHGRITVARAAGKVEKVTLSLYESPRLFEALLLGKGYAELPEIICRICSICSTVHRIASLQAVERALGVRVSRRTRLLRELILYGGHIQSHSLHLFCLALPDYLGLQGVPGLAAHVPDELKRGLRIKEVGNLIQERVGGRTIHPVTLIPGGMAGRLGRDTLLMLKDALQEILPEALHTFRLMEKLLPRSERLGRPSYLAVCSGADSPFTGDGLATWTGETVPAEAFGQVLSERVKAGTNAKCSVVMGQAPTVGALARLNVSRALTPEAATAFSSVSASLVDADILANNLAQAVELVLAAERALVVVDQVLEMASESEDPVPLKVTAGEGTAVIEAPRGVLVHSYGFDRRGHCIAADIVTPTAINQEAMERDLTTLALRMQDAGDPELTTALERLVRAYDPCISCAVHVLHV